MPNRGQARSGSPLLPFTIGCHAALSIAFAARSEARQHCSHREWAKDRTVELLKDEYPNLLSGLPGGCQVGTLPHHYARIVG